MLDHRLAVGMRIFAALSSSGMKVGLPALTKVMFPIRLISPSLKSRNVSSQRFVYLAITFTSSYFSVILVLGVCDARSSGWIKVRAKVVGSSTFGNKNIFL